MRAMAQKLGWIGGGIAVGVALTLAVTVSANRTARGAIPLEELRLFSEVFTRIKNDYVVPVEDRRLIELAISGMVSGLDPHSAYLDERAFKELRTTTSGRFGGIGIEIGVEDGYIKVVSPIDDTPAARAGLRAGDLIMRVDGESTRGMSTAKAVERMRGTPGTKVKLEVFRKEERTTETITLTREIIKIAAVRARQIEPGYAYVRVRTFNENTVADAVKAITDLNARSPLKGIVLDLRNNPGGLLDAAVGLSAAFLPEDALVVYTEGRMEGTHVRYLANREFYARRGPDPLADLPKFFKTVPLVVLTNGGSASASEIVAGALQDHKRAIVMGTPTFGKGSVQNIIPLTATTGMKLTTSRYFTPSGRAIQARGIEPEIVIEQLTWDGVMAPKVQRERDLARHLHGREEDREETPADEDLSEEAREARLQKAREDAKKLRGFDWGNEKDFVFAQAVNYLKGLPVVRSTVGNDGRATAAASSPAAAGVETPAKASSKP
ncbi:MAG: S41 family peptidase [Casimicrobiaceae bacterium]|nr:S41 family peptidase [Casimicrobiaceae bacterium]MCX8098838.1 S41 family peptidase [Casimicrobiaceae bacterium]MDW8311509.1 S41 family peptidase [Burkholderiales bacterium]